MQTQPYTVARELLRRLSVHEKECIRLKSSDLSLGKAAKSLGISRAEVEEVIASATRKLGCNGHDIDFVLAQLETWDKGGKERLLEKYKGFIKVALSLDKDNRVDGRLAPSEAMLLRYFLNNSRKYGYNDHNFYAGDDFYDNLDYSVYYEEYDGDFVEDRITGEDVQKNIDERLSMLDEFVENQPGIRISDYARRLFPELRVAKKAELPKEAPAYWTDERLDGESPTDFIRRNYGEWLGKGLTRADVKSLDPKLYQALATWSRRHPEDVIDLPTRSEVSASWVERVQAGEEVAPRDQKGAARLASALRKRVPDASRE